MKKWLMRWFPNYTCMACGCEIQSSDNAYLCPKCMQNLPLYDEVMTTHYAPFRYAEPVRSMILKLKYRNNGFIAKALAPYLAAVYLRLIKGGKDYVLVPVPLYRGRQNERGYNQSLVIAQELSEYLHLPVADALQRTRKTIIQKHMDAATRATNVKGAFAMKPTMAPAVQGRNILLIDDVYTTGATTNECAAVLRQAGAAGVKILTIAAVGFND